MAASEVGSFVVSIKAKIEGYQAELDKVKKALATVGKDLPIAKELNAAISQVEKRLATLGKNTDIRISNESQILRLQDNVMGVEQAFADLGNVMQRVGSLQMDTELSAQYNKIVQEIDSLNQQMSNSFNRAFADAEKSSSTFADFMKQLNLDPSKDSLDKMNEKVSAYGDAAQKAYETAQQAAAEAQSKVDGLNEAIAKTAQIDLSQFEQLKSLGSMLDVTGNGNAGALNLTLKDANVETLRQKLDSFFQNLKLKTEDAKTNLTALFTETFSESTLQNADEFIAKIRQLNSEMQKKGAGTLSNAAGITGIDNMTQMEKFLSARVPAQQIIQNIKGQLEAALAQLPQGFQGDIAAQIAGLGNDEQNVKQIQDKIAKIVAAIEKGAADCNKARMNLEQQLQPAMDKLNDANIALEGKRTANESAQANVAQFRTIIQQQQAQIAKLQSQVEQLRAQLAAIQDKASKTTSPAQQAGKETVQRANSGMQQAINESKQYEAQLERVKAAQAGLDNFKAFVQRWFSVYAAARMVSQAFNSVKNTLHELDDVMTEIAIVTDMTQADLWNQMADYTAMAKQYASSIKGVYEVSQLYYQQGLQTADVMAMTEQTLKMARISSLDYTTATNYMTNAVRSFKMEMSDAQTVVDVYSALAASAATDTAELATAMSKTASSAESVGSSFENTSAMMAVMIEATREGAENIGSAMKSIISRYGEMTSDPTKLIDSEGEAMSLNKVDKALQTVGISIHDATGQFRDFDDVIMELAGKWDEIDANTQRYIATIMAKLLLMKAYWSCKTSLIAGNLVNILLLSALSD